MPNNAYAKKASDYLESCMKNQDSSGGIVECRVKGMPAGIGETVFDKLDASLAKQSFPLALSKVWKSVMDLKLQKPRQQQQ